MAFQVGIIKISGTIDNLSFYKSVHGYLVRKKGGPAREKVKNSPEFQRSRENSAEFGKRSRFASEIRRLVISHTNQRDVTLYHRLMKLANSLLKEDKTSVRGERCPFIGLRTEPGRARVKEFGLKECSLLEIIRKSGLVPGALKAADQVSGNHIVVQAATRLPGTLHNRPPKEFLNRVVLVSPDANSAVRKRFLVQLVPPS